MLMEAFVLGCMQKSLQKGPSSIDIYKAKERSSLARTRIRDKTRNDFLSVDIRYVGGEWINLIKSTTGKFNDDLIIKLIEKKIKNKEVIILFNIRFNSPFFLLVNLVELIQNKF